MRFPLPARAYARTDEPELVDYDAPGIVDVEEHDADNEDSRRHQDIAKAFAILRSVADAEHTLYELAKELNVNQRTVRRYIYALRRVGIDIVARQGGQFSACRYRLDRRSYYGLLHLPKD